MNFIKAVLLFVALLVIGGVLMVVALFKWGDPGLNAMFLRSFGWITRKIVGIEQIVLHEERLNSRRPCVIVANHQSGLDMAFLGSVCPTASVIVAKKSIQYIPLFGWFFKAAQNILIDRSKGEDAIRMINAVIRTLTEKNLNLAIFPEGTRNRHGAGDEVLLPFKRGGFRLAVNTRLPLVPVVCSSLKGKGVWENHELNGGVIVISVLEPIETSGIDPADADAFCARVRGLMIEEVKRINVLADKKTHEKKEK